MNRQQVIQLIIFALFIGASGIGWILRRIGEQAQRRAAEQALERRRLELLRTGRDPGLSSPQARGTIGPARVSAGGELTVAERRQRQLEELRRRQLARSQGQAGSQGGVASPSRDSRRIGEAQVRVPDMNAAKTGRGSPAGRQGTARTPAPLGPSPSSQSF
ncbi:MAG TPA: hypothetical protein PKU91_05335, partial [Phycisphaerales bacterium]|nr:hypothetical protein [Phycisphaerales bacterium]